MAFAKSRRSEFQSYDEYQSTFNGSKYAPITLFIGSDDFLVEQCIDQMVDHLVPPESRSFNLDVMYGSRADAKDVVAHASSFPMLGERRVVIVKEFEKLVLGESAKEVLSAYIQRPLESTCMILVSEDPDFRKRPFPELKKSATIVSCYPLYDNQVPAWVTARIKAKGRIAADEACRLLQAYVGNSLRSLDNEIDKLLIYIGDRKEITVEDIGSIVGASKGFTVFDLQSSVGRKDAREALSVLGRMLEAGESPQMIIVMLTRFFTTLMRIAELRQRRVAESQFATELRISPYFLRQYMEYASNYSPAQLEDCFRALLAADAELKSSYSEARLVMDVLVYSLVNNAALHSPVLS